MTENNGLSSDFKIQVSDSPSGGQVFPEMSMKEFVDGTKERLQSVGSVVTGAVEPFFNRLEVLPTKPSECAIEFGVNIGGEAGVPFITKGTIGANFKIVIKWNWENKK